MDSMCQTEIPGFAQMHGYGKPQGKNDRACQSQLNSDLDGEKSFILY